MESAKTYNKDDVFTNAIGVFGASNQIIVSIEELSELQKELTKTLRGKFNREHVVEELADVEIMLEQLKIIFNIKDLELNETKYNKIKRLKEIISERIKGKTSEVMQKLYGEIIKGPVSEPAND